MKIRIIGGEKRRRIIEIPEVIGLRPTPDRMRETLFNWLGQTLPAQWHVLDAFAGTGVLGFEAISRGAGSAIFIEQSPTLIRHLHRNRELLGFDQTSITIIKGDALHFFSKLAASNFTFDIIFLDPPYHSTQYDKVILAAANLLKPNGFLYIESPTPLSVEHSSFTTLKALKEQKMGQVCAHLWQNTSTV